MSSLEKAARALWDARETTLPERTRMRWEDGTEIAKATTVAQVRAVLLAVREPGPEVGDVGMVAMATDDIQPTCEEALAGFAAIIDAILEPGDG